MTSAMTRELIDEFKRLYALKKFRAASKVLHRLNGRPDLPEPYLTGIGSGMAESLANLIEVEEELEKRGKG